MKTVRLVEHFERVADSPGATSRLRRLILDLAVRGKLVTQDPTDEPAERLQSRALSSHAQATDITNPGDGGMQIPASWTWVTLGNAADIEMGQSPSSEHYNKSGQGMPFFQGKADFGIRHPTPRSWCTAPSKIARKGDILISVRAPVGPTNIAIEECCIGRGLAALRPGEGVDLEYLWLSLRAFAPSLSSLGFGTTFEAINKKHLATFTIPLAPLREQRRIVARVEELMTVCDRLEAAQSEREARRDRVVAASLRRLNGPADPPQLRKDVQFHFSQLPRITTRGEHVSKLREAILSLGVRGCLAAQDPEDEPAAAVLRRITLEKEDLAKRGLVKRDKLLLTDPKAALPFELPGNWIWTQLQEVFEISRGGSPRPAGDPAFFGGLVPWITVGEITKDSGKFLTHVDQGLTEQGAVRSRFVNPGDLLLTNSGATLGVPKICQVRGCINDGVAVLRQFHSFDINDFAYLFLQSQTEAFRRVNQGMGQPNLNTSIIAGWVFPLPPLAEQRRIVAKVDELMAVCDRLEAKIATGASTRSRLLEALLHEALATASAVA